MSVYKTKRFARFARKAKLDDIRLLDAARAVSEGRADADLGGGVFKQRVAREGAGKSGGFRTIILFRAGAHTFFVHGFAKNAQANITAKELEALKTVAEHYLAMDEDAVAKVLSIGEIIEVEDDGEDKGGG